MSQVASFRARWGGGDPARSASQSARAFEAQLFRDANDPELWALWGLLEREGDCTVFQSARFLQPLLNVVGVHHHAEAHLCIASDRIGPLVALPFVRLRKGGAQFVGFADFGLSDYCAPLMAKRFDSTDAGAWDALWRCVQAQLPASDILSVEKIPGLVAGRLNPMIRMRHARPMQRETRQVAVDPLWLKTSVAKEALSKRRKMQRAGDSRFVIIDDPAQIDVHLDTMRTLRGARFNAQGIRDSLEDPGAFGFYRSLLRAGCADGGAVLGVLFFDGAPVALTAALVHRGRFNGVLTAMDEKAGAFSLGLVSMVGLFEWCLDNGVSVFDLGFGEQHYKSRFGGERSMLHEWSEAQTVRGGAWKLARDARWLARQIGQRYPTVAARLSRRGGKSG